MVVPGVQTYIPSRDQFLFQCFVCCKCVNEPSASIKCWELWSDCRTCGASGSVQLHGVNSYALYLYDRLEFDNVNACRAESFCGSSSTRGPYYDQLAQ
jgi:hypothetical protein